MAEGKMYDVGRQEWYVARRVVKGVVRCEFYGLCI